MVVIFEKSLGGTVAIDVQDISEHEQAGVPNQVRVVLNNGREYVLRVTVGAMDVLRSAMSVGEADSPTTLPAQGVASYRELAETLHDLTVAMTAEVNEKGGGGYILARLSDAQALLSRTRPPAGAEGDKLARDAAWVEYNQRRPIGDISCDVAFRAGWIAAFATLPSAEQAREEEWQPIETVPQDDADYDFWLDWAADCKSRNPPVFCQFRGRNLRWSSVYEATHWRPLPAPPRQRKGS